MIYFAIISARDKKQYFISIHKKFEFMLFKNRIWSSFNLQYQMNKVNFFCINLQDRADRWADCKKQFEKQKINVTRWNATPLPENRRFWAWLSHREIIEHAKINNWDYVAVFEDDIKFLVDNFYERCEEALKELNDRDWYILYFWGSFWKWGSLKKEKELNKTLRVKNLHEGHSIVYSKNFYDIYLAKHPSSYSKEIWKYYIDDKYTAFDQWYANYVQIKYPCYITKTMLVSQKDDFSSIENRQVWRASRSVVIFYLYKYHFWYLVEKWWKYIKILLIFLGFNCPKND